MAGRHPASHRDARMSERRRRRPGLNLGRRRDSPSEIVDWQPLLDYYGGNPLTLRVLVGQAIKAGVRVQERIDDFVEQIRSGEQQIEDADTQGRDKSLGASLDYGFQHAFKDDNYRSSPCCTCSRALWAFSRSASWATLKNSLFRN